jgi:hypothetical protein
LLAGFVACPLSDSHLSAQFTVLWLRLDIRGFTFSKYLTASACLLVTYRQTAQNLLPAIVNARWLAYGIHQGNPM